ncbi:hypothetical protein J5N97_006662 [Dioscorea zingiberensis]|uniref:Uncharacterized protein n=1 Tax=Dioscorea zingiberensis TaxID=325984 RepID=A0A9D5HTS9_9LILI|nr:hypothetical protein J5N97_006662 [Dioscorea zingiberensis]
MDSSKISSSISLVIALFLERTFAQSLETDAILRQHDYTDGFSTSVEMQELVSLFHTAIRGTPMKVIFDQHTLSSQDHFTYGMEPTEMLDSWAICRIFKKTSSMAQRALQSHAWASSSPLQENYTESHDMFSASQQNTHHQLMQQQVVNGANDHYLPLDVSTYRAIDLMNCKPSLIPVSAGHEALNMPTNFIFSSPSEVASLPSKHNAVDVASVLEDEDDKSFACIDFSHPEQSNGFMVDLPPLEMNGTQASNIFNGGHTLSFPFSLLSDDQWAPCSADKLYS